MRVVFRPEAQRELLEARAWYEERSPGLGFEFARAVDVAVAIAERMPLAFPRIEADFPYSYCISIFVMSALQGDLWP